MAEAASPSLGGEWLFADDPSSPVEDAPSPPLRDPRASTAVCGLPVWVTDLFCFGPISATTDQVLRQARGRRVPTALLPPTVTRVDVLAVNRLSLTGDPVYVRVFWDGADLGATSGRRESVARETKTRRRTFVTTPGEIESKETRTRATSESRAPRTIPGVRSVAAPNRAEALSSSTEGGAFRVSIVIHF